MKNDFKQLGTKLIYKARLFDLKKVKTRRANGHEFIHDVLFHPGAAVIVPMLTPRDFVLIRQYRTAVDKVIWEFPAGTLEKGESPINCAKREVIEETGYRAKQWKKLGTFYPAPGISTELMHLYLATNLVSQSMSLDQDEFIQKRIVSAKQLEKMILKGTIVDAKTIIGFFYYLMKCQRYLTKRRG